MTPRFRPVAKSPTRGRTTESSAHLLSIALFLLAADARRLVDVLVLGRPAGATPQRTPFHSRRFEHARLVLEALYIGGSLVVAMGTASMIRKMRDALPGGAERVVLRYERPDPAHLTIEGALGDQRLAITLAKTPDPEFALTSYRFHWIQETPYND